MLKIENVVTPSPEQWAAIIRGVRNPMNSWDLSDSYISYDGIAVDAKGDGDLETRRYFCEQSRDYNIGSADEKLMAKLRDAGSDHAKYRRMIPVIFDVIAPLYWWKEFDTYKVGTVANSCSTMHKIQEKEFTLDDFSHEHLDDDETCCEFEHADPYETDCFTSLDILKLKIKALNYWRGRYNETKDKHAWYQMIQLLDSSYNQRRTISLNYEVLANIYHARKNHKLDCWHTFCDWIESLPESWIITGEDNNVEINR